MSKKQDLTKGHDMALIWKVKNDTYLWLSRQNPELLPDLLKARYYFTQVQLDNLLCDIIAEHEEMSEA